MSEEKAFAEWIEKIAKSIPGFKGYYKKEERREMDQRLREKVAHNLKAIKNILNEKGRAITKSGDLSPMDEIASIDKKLEKLSDSILYAEYGYSGFFDQKEISESTLRFIYKIDTELMEWANRFTSNSNLDTDLTKIAENIEAGFDLLKKRSKIIEEA